MNVDRSLGGGRPLDRIGLDRRIDLLRGKLEKVTPRMMSRDPVCLVLFEPESSRNVGLDHQLEI